MKGEGAQGKKECKKTGCGRYDSNCRLAKEIHTYLGEGLQTPGGRMVEDALPRAAPLGEGSYPLDHLATYLLNVEGATSFAIDNVLLFGMPKWMVAQRPSFTMMVGFPVGSAR